jgi:DhnA family fructose-bisphosphate aldolase class Ia
MAELYSQLSPIVDAVVAQKGVVSYFSALNGTELIAHLSVSTEHGGSRSADKVLVGTVAEAVSRGAIAVSVQINVGSPFEADMIERMGEISTQCHDLGVPLLGMMYARGENLQVEGDSTRGVAHAVRLGWELGCDVIKTSWTGDMKSFEIVTSSVPIPVLIAGGNGDGSKENVIGLLKIIEQSILAGGAGVCMGRQVFAHPNPAGIAAAIRAVVHEEMNPVEAMELI